MKHMKIVQVPESTKEVVDAVVCDLCGKPIIIMWGSAEEVKVSHKTGNSNSDCGDGQETSVDMCSKCFDEKLVPWLKSQGAEPRIEDWEWSL